MWVCVCVSVCVCIFHNIDSTLLYWLNIFIEIIYLYIYKCTYTYIIFYKKYVLTHTHVYSYKCICDICICDMSVLLENKAKFIKTTSKMRAMYFPYLTCEFIDDVILVYIFQ